MINAGTYNDVEVVDHGFDKSSKGTPCFWTVFRLDDGQEITGYFYLSEKSAEFTFDKIAAMGAKGVPLKDLADGKALAGNLVQIVINHEEYDGKLKARVQFVNKNNSSGSNGPSRDENAAASAASYEQLWKKFQRTNIVEDDEIPF